MNINIGTPYLSWSISERLPLPPKQIPSIVSLKTLANNSSTSPEHEGTRRLELERLPSLACQKLALPPTAGNSKPLHFRSASPLSEVIGDSDNSVSLSSSDNGSLDIGEEDRESATKKQRLCTECTAPCLRPKPEEEQNTSSLRFVGQKQHRLLILRHVTRCPVEIGQTCPVFRCCGEAKMLSEHIKKCRDTSCSVDMCLSSRYIITHHRRCKLKSCPVCVPVRRITKRVNLW